MHRNQEHTRIYYRVTPGSPAMAAITRLQDAHEKAGAAVNEVHKKLRLPKAMNMVFRGRVLGFTSNPWRAAYEYAQKHIDTWKWNKKYDYASPRRNTPAGKAAEALFNAQPRFPDGHDMNRELVGVKGLYFSGMSIVFAGYARYHDEYVVSLPSEMVLDAKSKRPPKKQPKNGFAHDNQMPVIPEGLTEMKQSEAVEFLARINKAEEKETVDA